MIRSNDRLAGGAPSRLARYKRAAYSTWQDRARNAIRNNYAHAPTYSDIGDYANAPDEFLAAWRDVGDAHDIVRLNHTGWFTDAFQDSKYTGHVWQLPARGGVCQYVAGYHESEGSGYNVLDCTRGAVPLFDSKEEAARAADGLAERMAEREREYQEGWQEARQLADECDDLREAMKTERAKVTAVANAWRDQSRVGALADSVRAMLRDKIHAARGSFSEALAELIEKRDELAAHPRAGDI